MNIIKAITDGIANLFVDDPPGEINPFFDDPPGGINPYMRYFMDLRPCDCPHDKFSIDNQLVLYREMVMNGSLLDINVLIKNIGCVTSEMCEKLGISDETTTLLLCIRDNKVFPDDIVEIDELVINTLAYHNEISQLNILKERFKKIDFDIVNDEVTNLVIKNSAKIKNARKLSE